MFRHIWSLLRSACHANALWRGPRRTKVCLESAPLHDQDRIRLAETRGRRSHSEGHAREVPNNISNADVRMGSAALKVNREESDI